MASGGESVEGLLRGTAYTALRVLGRGGMGLVLLAERNDLGRKVAVKVLHGDLAKDAGIVDRLRIEAQTLGRITSPHVVQVLDLGKTGDGRPFLVMEHLLGQTLRDRIKDGGPLPPDLALDVADQALRGLGEAHALGVVHRDVKPENVFLAEDRPGAPPVVKVLDFGVAKVLRGSSGIAPPVVPTDEGVTVGTPRYLAPEQVLGAQKIDARADVYAMGLVLWATLVGKFPFDDCNDAIELAKRQIRGAELPPPSTLVPGLPRAVDALVARATAKERESRYDDAAAFRKAIEVARGALRAAKEPAAAPQPPRQLVTMAMETLDPSTLLEQTHAAPSDPSTLDGPTRDAPPELATVALPTIDRTAVPTTARSPGVQTMQSSVANRHAPVTVAMAAFTPTPPPVAMAAEQRWDPAMATSMATAMPLGATTAPRDQGTWRTFAVVVAVTVVVLGVIAAAVLFLGTFGIARHDPPVSSVAKRAA
jgi:serine/threonine protein kinase